MRLGETVRAIGKGIGGIAFAGILALAPAIGIAATPPAPVVQVPASPLPPPNISAVPAADVAAPPAAAAAEGAAAAAAPAAGSYTPMAPTPGKGMPVDGRLSFQDQYSPIGEYAMWMHDAILLPLIVVISLFVLALLLWVVVRFRRSANPVPSKTTHNVAIEVAWTLIPVLILVAIAVPSISLLAKQYKPAPKAALTVKATGYQWYWGYTYPDNGGFEVVSNMLKESSDVAAGERARTDVDGPIQLAVDNRMVVPAGEPIRLQTTAADVIHAFAVPAFWFKLDAVPGRINEKVLFIKEPGVYFGQCSELCGVRHGFMPIVVEALPRPQFEAWVLAQGGTVGPPVAAAAPATASAPAAAPAVSPAAAPAATSTAAPAA